MRALLLSAGLIALISASGVAWLGAGGPLPTGWCAAAIGHFVGRPVASGGARVPALWPARLMLDDV